MSTTFPISGATYVDVVFAPPDALDGQAQLLVGAGGQRRHAASAAELRKRKSMLTVIK